MIVLGTAAAISSASNPPTPGPRQVLTSPASAAIASDTTTTVPPSTTTLPTSTTTVPRPPAGPTTIVPTSPASTPSEPTTTTEPMPACQESQFVLTATTDKTTYAPGETVTISLTMRDTSSTACLDTGVMVWGCYGAAASNSTGAQVWESWAGPDGLPVNCPTTGYPTTIPGHTSTTAQVSWTQDECTQPVTNAQPNPDCPQVQVPSGPYEITGSWTIFPSPPPVTVDISSS